MYVAGLESLLYLIILLIPMLFLQRFLQREIQSIFLLITRQADISMALFSVIFLPGVLLHEISHFIMAHLLGVKTGRFSVIPRKMGNGRLQLGYVETASTDFFRDALIGAAPLISGGIVVAYIGISRLGLNFLWQSLAQEQADSIRMVIKTILDQPDFWLWFYLAFTISSTMLPSPADRKAWLPLIVILVVVTTIILIIGVGPWIASRFGSIIKSALDAITIVFATAALIHVILLLPVWGIRKILSRVTGLQVV